MESNEKLVISFVSVATFVVLQLIVTYAPRDRIRSCCRHVYDAVPSVQLPGEVYKAVFVIMVTLSLHAYFTSQTEYVDEFIKVPERPILAKQTIDEWTSLSQPTKECYPIDLNDRQQRIQAQSLMDHMQVRFPKGHILVTANEFNSNARILYMPGVGYMVNMLITPRTTKTKSVVCQNDTLDAYEAIGVQYYDYHFNFFEKEFTHKKALYLQCAFYLKKH